MPFGAFAADFFIKVLLRAFRKYMYFNGQCDQYRHSCRGRDFKKLPNQKRNAEWSLLKISISHFDPELR